MTNLCEYESGSRSVICTLTGKACFCPDSHLSCLRRTFALAYVARQAKRSETLRNSSQDP